MIFISDGRVIIDVILDDGTVAKGVADIDGKLGKLGGVAKKSAVSIGKIVTALGLVALAGKGIDMVRNSLSGAIARFDTLNQFPRVMQMIGFDAKQSEKAINRLSDGVQGLPTKLESVASTAQNIAVMTKDLDGAVDTTLALNNAFLASGASTADAERGLQQYVQMLSKGEVDLQSWTTLQETMGVALNQLAEDFGFAGKSAQNDLYDALKSGEITFDEFNAKLIEASERQGGFADMAKESSKGIETSWGNIKQAVVVGVTGMLQEIDKLLGGTGDAEDGFEGIVGVLETVKESIYIVFGWINKQIPKIAEKIKSIIDSVKKRFNDWKPTFDKIKGALEPLFDVFKQTADNIKTQLEPFLKSLRTAFESLMPILKIIGAIVGGVLLTSFIAFTSGINGLYNAVMPIITAFWNLVDVVVNVANSIIAILTGDFEAAWQFWRDAGESSVEFFKNLWDGIVGFIQGIVETVIGWFEFLYEILVGNSIIPDMVNAIIEWFSNLLVWAIEKVVELVNNVVDYFSEMKDKAIEKAIQFVGDIKDKFNQIKKAIINRISDAKSAVANKFTEMVTSVKNKATEIVNTARDKFNDVKNKIRDKMADAVKEVGKKVGEMPGKVVEKAEEMATAGKDLVLGLIDGIKGMGKDAIEAITGVVGGVVEKAKSLLKIKSPSRVFMEFGEFLSEGLAIGIDNDAGKAIKSMSKLAEGLSHEIEPEVNLLGRLKGFTLNKALGGIVPLTAYTGSYNHPAKTSKQQINNKIIIEPSTVVMDGREVGYVVWEPVKEHIDRDNEVKNSFRGGQLAF